MPGSTPPTSQLDWLSSTTAMVVLSWSKATRDLLKSFSWGIGGTPSVICQRRWCHLLAACPYHLFAGGRWIRTCMGLFLSSGHFGFLPVLCSEREGRSSSRRL